MLTGERRTKILAIIEAQKFVSVNQLSEKFNVHETTIRRDLDDLEAKGLVYRIHGGVVPSDIKSNEAKFEDRQTENLDEKIRIGQYISSLIRNNDCIILDSGTTTLQIAKSLNERQDLDDLTIVTNDINLAIVFKDNQNVNVIVTGGTLYHGSFMLNGPITDETLGNLNVDKVILATPALDTETGLNHFDELLVATKKVMIKTARTRIVAVDHTKIGHRALYAFLPISKIDLLVTGNEVEHKLVKEMNDNGIKKIKLV